MLKTDKVIVVEGKYDAIRLANIVDAAILRTEGFGVFKDKEKQELLRTLGEKRGLLVLTDGDSAGMLIRNYIRNIVPAEQITDVYVPDLYGKEKRKEQQWHDPHLVSSGPVPLLKGVVNRFPLGQLRDGVGADPGALVFQIADRDGMPRQRLGLFLVEAGDLILLTVGGFEDDVVDIRASAMLGSRANQLVTVCAEGHGGGLQL